MTEAKLPNEALQSQLSAFVDGELPQAETELLVRRLTRETEMQQTLGRYVLMGEALRAPAVNVPRNFSARIAAAIEQDAGVSTGAMPPTSIMMRRSLTWLKPAAGMAVAASVALVSIFTVHSWQSSQVARVDTVAQGSSSAAAAATQPVLAVNSPNDSYIVPAASTGSSVPIPVARLTNYVVAHSEFTTPLGRRTMVTGLLAGDHPSTEIDADTGVDQ